jgi:hypothetical protein
MINLHLVALPHAEESPKSVLQRTGHGNGANTIDQLASFCGLSVESLSLSHLVGESQLVQKLKAEAGDQAERFAQCFYTRTGGLTNRQPIRMLGADVPPAWLRCKYSAVCPLCIRDGFSKVIFDLKFIDACPYHGVSLWSHCPSCTTRIDWRTSRFDRCRVCKVRFTDCEPNETDSHGASRVLSHLRSGNVGKLAALVEALRVMHIDTVQHANERNSLLNEAASIVDQSRDALLRYLTKELQRDSDLPRAAIAVAWRASNNPHIRSLIKSVDREICTIPLQSKHSRPIEEDDVFSCQEMRLLLGICDATLRRLVKSGLLERKYCDRLRAQVYPKCSIRELVAKLAPSAEQANGDEPLLPEGRFTASIEDRIRAIESGRAVVTCADWSQGLRGIRVRGFRSPCAPAQAPPQQSLSVVQVAHTLGTYPDAIRRAMKARILGGRENSIQRIGTSVWINEQDVRDFDRDFVFLTALAKPLGEGRTILSAKLAHVGIRPVSGPSVDGGLVPIYCRAELRGINLRSVLDAEGCVFASGRRKGDHKLFCDTTWMPSFAVSMMLDCKPQSLSTLVKVGLLKEGIPQGRRADNRRYFDRRSVEAAKRWLETAKTLADVAASINMSVAKFRIRFVRNSAVKPLRLGSRVILGKRDIRYVEAQASRYVTVSQADQILGAPPKHFANLVRTRRFEPDSTTVNKKGALRLLSLAHVEAYAKRLNVEVIKTKPPS